MKNNKFGHQRALDMMLRWKEPASFKRALGRQNGAKPSPWYSLLFMLGIVAVCLGGTAYHNKPWMGSWSLTVALSTAAGFAVGYGVVHSHDEQAVVFALGPKVEVQDLQAAIAANGRELRVCEGHRAEQSATADRPANDDPS
jgi:hypothetical protein